MPNSQTVTLQKEDIAMVGDNYQTDIQAGIQYGMDTLMVLTGFSTREDLEKVEEQPTHLVEDLRMDYLTRTYRVPKWITSIALFLFF